MNLQDPTICRFLAKLSDSYDFESRKLLIETAKRVENLQEFMEELSRMKLQALKERW